MGPLEPIVCPEGKYCPPGDTTSIICPSGHFCSKGAYQPTKCSVASHCPPGSSYDMSFLPLTLLIFLDLIAIELIIGTRVREYMKRRPPTSRRKAKSLLRTAVAMVDMERRGRQYQSLEGGDLLMSQRPLKIERADTGFGGAIPDEPRDEDDLSASNTSSDLQMFIRSMSRCIGVTNFGLSFEFVDLAFLPRKVSKPVLSDITGRIDRGTLTGVIGASGAGMDRSYSV